MLQKIILAIAIFVVILVALTFGEVIFHDAFAWLSYVTGRLIENFSDLVYQTQLYLSEHRIKVAVALLLTVPITLWIARSKGDELKKPTNQRKVAIVLAFFLGWLGAHRFYLGQIGWGILYLIIFWLFTPLAVVLGLIDALRYLLMADDAFMPNRP
ncbi:TM2 domain-containing protein [Pusillimonas sp. ANT_WB101]|uniref:TM2 domain-containing protein n=1 Tax=Pusillimonas sp. ANT_WB101 TaxID=2597356 RepID=UPI0011EF7E12|nr:TM2 domain-containing protein [Pusillimonas sp. ANT_WB101]KAA0910726.1 TM2 domain-containing protein [Pusillimonas sp. ANT_WB101]NYT78271.1 TM2 domain-containing protein [Alcaligenaceae bacterium]